MAAVGGKLNLFGRPWSGGDQIFDNIRLVHETFPSKNLLFTEGHENG